MNRRAFLSLAPAALAGFSLDPERLLWRPGQKTIFVPSGKVFQPQPEAMVLTIHPGETVTVALSQPFAGGWMFTNPNAKAIRVSIPPTEYAGRYNSETGWVDRPTSRS